MRNRIASWILAASVAWVVSPSLAAAPVSADARAQADALRAASQAWMRAIEAKDRATLESFLAPEFELVAPGEAPTTPREEWLHNAVARDWSGFRYEALMPRVHGDHATVHSRLYFHLAPVPLELDAGIVDTWVRRDGRWNVTGRYLGDSKAAYRFGVVAGFALGLAAWALWALAARLRRRWARARV